ncbi:MAG: zinc-binding alcohol dehydrogenase family protein, partial [Actinomycetia bacterium]|nr:zinc-binding alcohol dehydrogenase family protein [Actinomycetes bacterium]
LAPLLCAGIIGYRALKRAALPPGGRLGLYGFGGSAHLAGQVALAQGATLSVMTRGVQAQDLARSLGATFVGGAADMPPEPLDAAILFAPVGDLVLPALAALDRGGTLAIAGIYLTDIPALSYDRYLFQERQLRSVTSNTRADAREFLAFAAEHRLSVTTHEYPLDAADRALADLKAGRFDGAAVLVPLPSPVLRGRHRVQHEQLIVLQRKAHAGGAGGGSFQLVPDVDRGLTYPESLQARAAAVVSRPAVQRLPPILPKP